MNSTSIVATTMLIIASATSALAAPMRPLQSFPHRTFAAASQAANLNAMQHPSQRAKRDNAQYNVIDDPDEGQAFKQGTFVFGINSAGAVVGYYDNGKTHGLEHRTDGSFPTIDMGKTGTAAGDINDKGDIAGGTDFYVDPGKKKCPGFLLTANGKLKKLEPLGVKGCSEDTYSIGNNGSIVGDYRGHDGAYHGFLRSKNGAIAAIDARAALATYASDINDSGMVVGTYIDADGYHGYIRSAEGTFRVFGAPGGPAEGDTAARTNDAGEVQGDYLDANGVADGLIRQPDGSSATYDAPDAGHASQQGTYGDAGINSDEAIAGYYYDANSVPHGYVRSSDGALTEFDPPGSIWTVVWDINDSGAVAGTYMDQFGNFHGFLRTPSPEG